jgi:hypothetical protein
MGGKLPEVAAGGNQNRLLDNFLQTLGLGTPAWDETGYHRSEMIYRRWPLVLNV